MAHILESEKARKILADYHITVPDRFSFSDVNLVIGPNGAGKTRFLKAVRDAYRDSAPHSVVYGYFPDLSACVPGDGSEKELPEFSLYEAAYTYDADFKDFFQAIESYNGDFIPELLQHLNYPSKAQQTRSQTTLDTVKKCFHILTGRELMIEAGALWVSGEEREPLSQALSRFSPGELMLFYISVFLSITQHHRKDKVIVLDEPELHLHPRVLVDFIKLLVETHDFSELWIATHSLFLVPEFVFENIVYVENSRVQPRNSALYPSVLTSLLGPDRERLAQFFSSLSQWQFCNYMAECFLNPTVIDTVNGRDEQVGLFVQFLKLHPALRILDYGGGSARLGLSLQETDYAQKNEIDYHIYDPNPQYTGTQFPVHRRLDEIDGTFDCVVMMNVLHEIEPEAWVEMFHAIRGLMREGSYLLFVEVSALTVGEMPNEIGFLVLGIEEIRELFESVADISEIKLKSGQKSVCIAIPADALEKSSLQTVHRALRRLEQRALKEIKQLRGGIAQKKAMPDQPGREKLARQYAFLSQLYLNAKLFNQTPPPISHAEGEPVITEQAPAAKKRQAVTGEINQILNNLNFSVKDEAYRPVQAELERMAHSYIHYGKPVSAKGAEACWRGILEMEAAHGDKERISLCLRLNALLGHQKSDARFWNQYYADYPFPLRPPTAGKSKSQRRG